MMNKFLSLILVLGMAAGANAAIQLSINSAPAPDTYTMTIGDVIVIDVMSDNAANYGAWLVLEDKAAGLGQWNSLMTVTPAAGANAYATDWDADYPGWWELSAASFNPDAPVVAGVHFLIDFKCLGEGDVVVTLRNYDESVTDTVTISQIIPEPITLALLGVGGLFLRRRK